MRGEGCPDLSWEKGIALKKEKPDEWVFETDHPFSRLSLKSWSTIKRTKWVKPPSLSRRIDTH